MPWEQAALVILSDRQRIILSTIILMAADGITNKQIARKTGLNRNKVKLWRIRRDKASAESAKVEAERPHALKAYIQSILGDEKRSGPPTTFTPEQVAHIMAIACQSSKDHGVPMSHWTPSELARQAVKQGIVKSISPRQVGRFLTDCNMKCGS